MPVGLPAKTTYANGDVFSADDINSTNGTINLIGQTNNFYAGKNRIINGDFFVNQRNFSSSTATGYGFDRWQNVTDGSSGTATFSAQTFTPGAAPVAGYEARNFLRCVTTGQSVAGVFTLFEQFIEDVRSIAGQTVTISFWAKAATGTPKIATEVEQYFGSGGSPSSSTSTYAGQVTISTSWARYSVTVAVPSISGKTIGTTANTSFSAINLWVSSGTTFNSRTGSLGIQSNTFDIWGVQVEAGSTATAFQTASGSIQGELALCQRYYYRIGGEQTFQAMALGWGNGSAGAYIHITTPVTMRVAPTALDYSTLVIGDLINNNQAVTVLLLTGNYGGSKVQTLSATVSSGLTVNRPYGLYANNSTSAFVGLSAEL